MTIAFRLYDHRQPVPVDALAAAAAVGHKVFTDGRGFDPDEVAAELAARPLWLLQTAVVGERVVGFKIGFRERAQRFRSWLGGVDPDFRRQGIARRLMADQHAWCIDHGFEAVRTTTRNAFRGMLHLNIAAGFDIVGTRGGGSGVEIVMQKRLKAPDPG